MPAAWTALLTRYSTNPNLSRVVELKQYSTISLPEMLGLILSQCLPEHAHLRPGLKMLAPCMSHFPRGPHVTTRLILGTSQSVAFSPSSVTAFRQLCSKLPQFGE